MPVQLNYKSFGSGEPILILHGLLGSLDNWQTIARELANDHTVFILDMRNHGRSPHDDIMNYPAMAEDVRMFMEDHWVYEAALMGHSMGGKVAMQLALMEPDMINKLIVVDMGPRKYRARHDKILDALKAVPVKEIEDRSDAEEILEEYIEEKAIRLFLMKNLSRNKGGGFKWKMNLPVLDQAYEDILGEINGPGSFEKETLFIAGGKSDYLKEQDMEDIRRLFPKAKLEMIPDAGHWVHSEAADAFLEKVRQFL